MYNRKNALPKGSRLPFRLLWTETQLEPSMFFVTVELTPLGAPDQMKRTDAGAAVDSTPSEDVWVWKAGGQELSFASMQTSTEFLLRVIRSVHNSDMSALPPDVLGSVRFTVDEDVVSGAVDDMLQLPLVLDDRVCGKVYLNVIVQCTDGFPVDCGLPKSYALHPNHAKPPPDDGRSGLEWMEEQEGALWSPRCGMNGEKLERAGESSAMHTAAVVSFLPSLIAPSAKSRAF